MFRRVEKIQHFFDRGIQQLQRYHNPDCGNHKQPFHSRESEQASCQNNHNRNDKLNADALLRSNSRLEPIPCKNKLPEYLRIHVCVYVLWFIWSVRSIRSVSCAM